MRPPLAVFTPLPPLRSGVADHAYEQLPELAREWSLAVVVDQPPDDVPPLPEGAELFVREAWGRDVARDRATPRLYHLGNNLHHRFVYEEARGRPGVVVLHDFVLHHLVGELTLAAGDPQAYRACMEHEHGALGRRMAEQRERGFFTELQQFHLPLHRRPLLPASGIIVHSRWAERRIRLAFPDKPVRRIPLHHVPPPPTHRAEDRRAARRRLGMPVDKLLLVSLGFATPSKRIDLILEALAEARSGLPDFEFWVVGEVHAPAGFRRGVAARGLEDRVRSTGYVPLDRFQLAIQAADVVISLRYPTAGESSAAQMRALGMGRATLSFDYAGFADTPADAGVKIPLDTRSATPLARALLRLGRDAGLRDRLGRAAAAWVAEHCSPQGCAAACGDLIRETSSLSSTPP